MEAVARVGSSDQGLESEYSWWAIGQERGISRTGGQQANCSIQQATRGAEAPSTHISIGF